LAAGPVCLHGVRHSYATAALVGGVPTEALSEPLGHSSTAVTSDTYQHVTPELDVTVAARVTGLILDGSIGSSRSRNFCPVTRVKVARGRAGPRVARASVHTDGPVRPLGEQGSPLGTRQVAARDLTGEARPRVHSWIGAEHYLLALLATPSIASETLEELGITHERVAESVRGRDMYIAARSDDQARRRGVSPTPAAYGLVGRAVAFAAAAGERQPRPEHWLLAIVWSDTSSVVSTLHHLGAEQTAVLDGLRQRGVPLPEVEPPLYRPWRGSGHVEVAEEELQPLLDVLGRIHPPGSESRWGFNWTRAEPRCARVVAEDGIDLDAALRESRDQAG
jgi:hypothetical protein